MRTEKETADWNWYYKKNQDKIALKVFKDLDYWEKSGKDPIIALTEGLSRQIALRIDKARKEEREKIELERKEKIKKEYNIWSDKLIEMIDKNKPLAEELHNYYELVSKSQGWDTKKECKVRFDDLPESNKRVMINMAQFVNSKIFQERNKILDIIKNWYDTSIHFGKYKLGILNGGYIHKPSLIKQIEELK